MQMERYDQRQCERLISEMLTGKGYLVSRDSSDLPKYSVQAIIGEKKVRILVRHLEFDGAYNNSTLPYQVYKIEAFDNEEERQRGKEILQFVAGYNFKDGSFAFVPISEFSDKRSIVVHQREGLRANFYNSWLAIEEYIDNSGAITSTITKYVVWFAKKVGDERVINRYPVPDLRTAVIVLDTFIQETSCSPNALGLSVWDESVGGWIEWGDGEGHDIREFTVDESFEIVLRRQK